MHGLAQVRSPPLKSAQIKVTRGGKPRWIATIRKAMLGFRGQSNGTYQVKGEYTIMSKATDSAGRTQPAAPFWNRKGYGYHAIDQVKGKVE
ncbi:hypothetical protein P4475_03005 [Halalkalibacterium halodurans]|nr:hypothetical protein [Halalkalibacterium halodurans]